MELNKNILGVQSVLVKCSKDAGDFTKINYVGGNETHILKIASELTNFLTGRRLLEAPGQPSPDHLKELDDIVFFLALNTKFKRPMPPWQEYSHLTNIIPQLSKCLLANICMALNLVSAYGHVIESFPLQVTEELLDQMMDCLKRGNIRESLHNAFIVLQCTLNKISLNNQEVTEVVEDVLRIAGIILQNATFITTEEIEYKSPQKIYQHMGATLLRLLDLMLHIDPFNNAIKAFIPVLVSTTCSIMKCITVDIYCSWVEIEEGDETLQTLISGKAYSVLEIYQKNKMASELVGMLGAIARKPKTIAQRIMEADTATKIRMIDQKDPHQKSWFRALLVGPIFAEPDATACMETWWQLCDESAVDKLLNSSPPTNSQHRQLVVKCASNLGLDELSRVVIKHFNRKKYQWCEDITEQLVVFFNQAHAGMNVEELKQLLLLFLRNPQTSFQQLYRKAFKRSVELVQIFQLFKDLSDAENITRKLLIEIFEENPPTSQNVPNYIQLMATMLESQYHNWDFLVTHVILAMLASYKTNNQMEEFRCCLQMIKHFQDRDCQLAKEVDIFEYMLVSMSENRPISFLHFERIKQEVASHCVDYMLHKCAKFRMLEAKKESFPSLAANCTDSWSDYYRKSFWETQEISLLDFVLPDLNLSNYKEGIVDQNFISLFKTLPRCTPAEWKKILKELTVKFGADITLAVLSDIMCLLCDFTDNQTKLDNSSTTPLEAIQFCLQNYASFTATAPETGSDQLAAINDICRVLRHIPDPLKASEGMCLIKALPEEPLQSLAEDEQFVNRILLIGDKQLRQALAQKVLSSYQENA